MTEAAVNLGAENLGAVNLGALNGHAVGRILKEAVRRAATVIRAQRLTFEANEKQSYSGVMNDVCTSADRAAQDVYLRTFQECFPGCGVIAEEGELSMAPVAPLTAWFTVDPLDGTKAFVRRQSHGIATMIALVDLDEHGRPDVQAAYIADINSDEVYGYRPGSTKVHRITRLDTFETMGVTAEDLPPIDQLHGLLRDPSAKYGPEARKFIARFKSHEVMGSSIGVWAARLWKNEVNALMLRGNHETPWDATPVIGISRKLGYAFLKPEGDGWRAFDFEPPREIYRRDHDMLVIHESYLQDGWLKL